MKHTVCLKIVLIMTKFWQMFFWLLSNILLATKEKENEYG